MTTREFFDKLSDEQVVRELIRRMTNGRADLDSPGLLTTPTRVRKAWRELFPAYFTFPPDYDPATLLRFFPEPGAAGVAVEVKDIPVRAYCEHHLLPFQGLAMVRYLLAGNEVIGLSKIPRLVDFFARRLTTQERITKSVLAALKATGKVESVEVGIACDHDCMLCRGAKAEGTETKTFASWRKDQ